MNLALYRFWWVLVIFRKAKVLAFMELLSTEGDTVVSALITWGEHTMLWRKKEGFLTKTWRRSLLFEGERTGSDTWRMKRRKKLKNIRLDLFFFHSPRVTQSTFHNSVHLSSQVTIIKEHCTYILFLVLIQCPFNRPFASQLWVAVGTTRYTLVSS